MADRPKVKMLGEDGNVFFIIGRCHKAAMRAGWTEEQWKPVYNDMQSGNYDHALQVMMTHFDVE
jgi:hypothetical protein